MLISRICISVKDFCQILGISYWHHSVPCAKFKSLKTLEWLLVFLSAPPAQPMAQRVVCFVTCVSSRIAAGSHLRTFIRKMMYEAEGTQLDFQSPDWGCCSSSWRSFWHANFAWFWYRGECWMIKTLCQHIRFAGCRLSMLWYLHPGQGEHRDCENAYTQLSCRDPCCGIDSNKAVIRSNSVKWPHTRKQTKH